MTATVDRAELWRLQALEMPERSVKRDGVWVEGLEAKVERELKAAGFHMVYHTYDSRRSTEGYPDIVALRGSRQVVIELKSQRGRFSVAQDMWLEAYRRVGAEVYVFKPIHLLDGTIAKALL